MTSHAMSERRLRVAVWGLGRQAANRILPAMRAAAGVELYGVCSRNALTVAETAAACTCRGWTDPTAMLSDPDVDAVFVATPTGLHHEHGMQVLGARKHLWCEKPLTASLDHTLELLDLSRTLGLAVCEGFMYLHHPQFAALSRFLTEERLGTLRSISCRFGLPTLEHPGFRSDPNLGGGAFLDLGCYLTSAILALLPDARCDVRHAHIGHAEGSAVDTDGYAVIALSDGAVAQLEWRMNAGYRNEIEFWGERGSLFADRVFSKPPDYIPEFLFRDARGNRAIEMGEAGDHFVLMIDAFRRMVANPSAIEAERFCIARRAQLLGSVRSLAQRR